MKDNTKITLTFEQLKKLIKESNFKSSIKQKKFFNSRRYKKFNEAKVPDGPILGDDDAIWFFVFKNKSEKEIIKKLDNIDEDWRDNVTDEPMTLKEALYYNQGESDDPYDYDYRGILAYYFISNNLSSQNSSFPKEISDEELAEMYETIPNDKNLLCVYSADVGIPNNNLLKQYIKISDYVFRIDINGNYERGDGYGTPPFILKRTRK